MHLGLAATAEDALMELIPLHVGAFLASLECYARQASFIFVTVLMRLT